MTPVRLEAAASWSRVKHSTTEPLRSSSLVLVKPRETRPCLIERSLMGRKESNQTIKILIPFLVFVSTRWDLGNHNEESVILLQASVCLCVSHAP